MKGTKDDLNGGTSIFIYIAMDYDTVSEFLNLLSNTIQEAEAEVKALVEELNPVYVLRLTHVLHLVVPIATAFLFYYYFKYLLIFDAHKYESYVKRRSGRIKKVSRQLKQLSRLYENVYFCYMPMNHGTAMPQPYTLFTAIKEVLLNSNRPATRILRTNLLHNLHNFVRNDDRTNTTEEDLFGLSLDEHPSEFNLVLMKYCRELIIQGVKDFDVMSTVYRVMDTAMEDGE